MIVLTVLWPGTRHFSLPNQYSLKDQDHHSHEGAGCGSYKKWDSSLSTLINSCINLHSGDWVEASGEAPSMSGPQLSLLRAQGERSMTRWTTHSKGPDPGRMSVKRHVAWMHGHEHPPVVERGPPSVLDSSKHSCIFQRCEVETEAGGRQRQAWCVERESSPAVA